MDPLADVLDLSRVHGALTGNVRARAPWGLDIPAATGASFHAVISGTAWLRIGRAEPLQLMPGDALLLRAGGRHKISSEPEGRCVPFGRSVKTRMTTPGGDLAIGSGTGALTTIVCASYSYDLDVAEPLMGLLPAIIHVPADPAEGHDVAAIVELLGRELGARRPGARAAGARLIDLLLIAAIRHWAATAPDGEAPSWLRALRDPQVAHVIALVHERPDEPWTVATLAGEVHLSRAALARRFGELVGEPPLTYLTRWRMHVAAQRLKYTDETVETVARRVGYRSEYAFSRAFARDRGQPPGRYRRRARLLSPVAAAAGGP